MGVGQLLALMILAFGAGDDVRARLAELSSPVASERVAAEQWLAERIGAADYPLVAEFLARADAEAQARLAQALGAHDAQLDLATLLASDDAPNARRAGEQALRRMVSRWDGAAKPEARSGERVWEELRGRFEGVFALELGAADLDEHVELLAREAPIFVSEGGASRRVALVLDPPLFETLARARAEAGGAPRRTPSWREGAFDTLLQALTQSNKAAVEAFGFDGDAPWLWVHSAPADATANAAELVRSWCRSVVLGRERTRGEAAARALAQCGWPAAMPWLTGLWLERNDGNALAGVLVGAARGRVAPALLRTAALDGLLAEFERREREVQGPRWERFRREFALALARFPQQTLDGDDVAARVAQWAEREPASRARVEAALEIFRGLRTAPAPWRARIETLASSSVEATANEVLDAGQWLRALGAWAALVEGPCAPRTIRLEFAQLAQLLERRRDGEWLELLERVCAAPAVDDAARARLGSAPAPTRALWIEALMSGAAPLEAAAALVRDWIDGAAALEPLGTRLARRVRRGDGRGVARLLELARAGTAGRSAERAKALTLLAGTMPMLERQRWFELASEQPQLSDEDWPLFGALAYAGGSPVYAEFVLERAQQAVEAGAASEGAWARAFEQAYAGAAGRGERELAERLRRELWLSVRRTRHPLQERMEREEWPPLPGPRARVLALR